MHKKCAPYTVSPTVTQNKQNRQYKTSGQCIRHHHAHSGSHKLKANHCQEARLLFLGENSSRWWHSADLTDMFPPGAWGEVTRPLLFAVTVSFTHYMPHLRPIHTQPVKVCHWLPPQVPQMSRSCSDSTSPCQLSLRRYTWMSSVHRSIMCGLLVDGG